MKIYSGNHDGREVELLRVEVFIWNSSGSQGKFLNPRLNNWSRLSQLDHVDCHSRYVSLSRSAVSWVKWRVKPQKIDDNSSRTRRKQILIAGWVWRWPSFSCAIRLRYKSLWHLSFNFLFCSSLSVDQRQFSEKNRKHL